MINYDGISGEKDAIQPMPAAEDDGSSVDDLAEKDIDIEGSTNEIKGSREGKFLVYWMTTTSITTMTSYSATRTVASLICTPSGYGISQCG